MAVTTLAENLDQCIKQCFPDMSVGTSEIIFELIELLPLFCVQSCNQRSMTVMTGLMTGWDRFRFVSSCREFLDR